MPDPDFAARIAALHAAQREGRASPPGVITRAELAAWLGYSETSIERLEAIGLAKTLRGLLAAGVTPSDIPTTDHP